jgi:hypothetical protein
MGFVTDAFHSVTDAVGLTDYKGQEEARDIAKRNADLANKQADRSYNLTREELDFQREQYNDWKEIYGPLQEDLGTYYKNLTGETLSTRDLVEIQKASQQAQEAMDRQLAQRGLSQSGLEADSIMRNQLQTAQLKANARATADERAAQQKMGFLGLGLGQGSQMLGINAGVSNSGASNAVGLANTFGNMSNNALGIGAKLSQMNTGIMNQYAGTAIGAMGANGMFGSGYASMLQGGK